MAIDEARRREARRLTDEIRATLSDIKNAQAELAVLRASTVNDFDYDAHVADWPELTSEQKDQLAILLHPGIKQRVTVSSPSTKRRPPQTPQTDTVTNTAKRFGGLSEWTIRKLINEGKIQARYAGRRVLVIQQSVADYIEALPSER
jgi:hypothetical protein